jgi:hypothetical protein
MLQQLVPAPRPGDWRDACIPICVSYPSHTRTGHRPNLNIRLVLRLAQLAAAALCCASFIPATHAQTAINVSGRYQCAQAKIHGKTVPCTGGPLTLKNDGRFELRGWEGNYLVTGEWVELSDSIVRSRAKIEPGHRIVFRYLGKHGWCEMVYERRVAELGKTSLT